MATIVITITDADDDAVDVVAEFDPRIDLRSEGEPWTEAQNEAVRLLKFSMEDFGATSEITRIE